METFNRGLTEDEFDFVEHYVKQLCFSTVHCTKVTLLYSKPKGSRVLVADKRKAFHSTEIMQNRYGAKFPIDKAFACIRASICCPFQSKPFSDLEFLSGCPGDYGIEDDLTTICARSQNDVPENAYLLRQIDADEDLQAHSLSALFAQHKTGLIVVLVIFPFVSIFVLTVCCISIAIRDQQADERLFSESLSSYALSNGLSRSDDSSESQRSRRRWVRDQDDHSSLLSSETNV